MSLYARGKYPAIVWEKDDHQHFENDDNNADLIVPAQGIKDVVIDAGNKRQKRLSACFFEYSRESDHRQKIRNENDDDLIQWSTAAYCFGYEISAHLIK